MYFWIWNRFSSPFLWRSENTALRIIPRLGLPRGPPAHGNVPGRGNTLDPVGWWPLQDSLIIAKNTHILLVLELVLRIYMHGIVLSMRMINEKERSWKVPGRKVGCLQESKACKCGSNTVPWPPAETAAGRAIGFAIVPPPPLLNPPPVTPYVAKNEAGVINPTKAINARRKYELRALIFKSDDFLHKACLY